MDSQTRGAAAPERPALRALGRLVVGLAAAAMALAAACLLVSLALIGWAVVLRYVFNDAPIWVDEVVGFALVAVVMLAAPSALRRGEHINVDLLIGFLSPTARRWARGWAAVATLIVAGLLVVNGSETATLAHTLGLLTEGSLEWPTWLLMLFMPIGGALLGLAALEALWRVIVDAPPTDVVRRIEELAE
ncbi:MAG: TRAP transporter small permease [Burkholderiaceae bacterium]|nr:TRAP transporter small permease [Burkholderiaceae bacterium]